VIPAAVTLENVETLGRILVLVALVLGLLGALALVLARFGLHRLPGDVLMRRGNFTFYVPLGVMIVLSLVLTIVLNLFFRR
jgi:multisubunit Na+/H+ antiporter MnhG subunit